MRVRFGFAILFFWICAKPAMVFAQSLKNPATPVRENAIDLQEKETRYTSKLKRATENLQQRLDSLSELSAHEPELHLRLQQIQTRLDSVKDNPGSKKKTSNKIKFIEGKLSAEVDSLKRSIDKEIGKIKTHADAINSKITDVSSHLKVNSVDLPQVNVPGVSDLPSTDKIALPNTSTIGFDATQNALNTAEVSQPIETANLGTQSATLPQLNNSFSKYQDDLSKLNPANVEDKLQSEFNKREELNVLQESTQKFEDVKKNWNDPAVLKEQGLNKAKETAVNHFAGHEEQLKSVMEKLSKLKSKVSNPEGTIDLYKKRQQLLKQHTVAERLLPGIAIQFQKHESYWLDINPHIGFRVAQRLTVGTGWNQRIAYSFRETSWENSYRIHGIRNFIHFKLKENFHVTAEAEIMNSPFKKINSVTVLENQKRIWTWSYFGGVKKDFKLSPQLKCNAQVLYNLHTKSQQSPYLNRINIRMGLEFILKRKTNVRAENN